MTHVLSTILFLLTLAAPYAISFLIGLMAVVLITRERRLNAALAFGLAFGLGTGISAVISFLSFLVLNIYARAFTLGLHGALAVGLAALMMRQIKKKNPPPLNSSGLDPILYPILMAGLVALLFAFSNIYPSGGWDAWQVWNFKAKFLFLSSGNWRDLFDPVLWRSSPHYPLLLPLINVWGWTFQRETTLYIPLVTSVLFGLMTGSLVFGVLRHYRLNPWIACAVTVLPFINSNYTIALTSQYCDALVGFYILAALALIVIGLETDELPRHVLSLAGLFIGLLSFTKPEGAVAAAWLGILATAFLIRQRAAFGTITGFFLSIFIAAIPMIIFTLVLNPGNQTFINGLTSTESPSSWLRLKAILMFLWMEPISRAWGGLWILIVTVGIISLPKSVTASRQAFPIFFLLYLGTVTIYYWVNTHFEILWWLSVSLQRILVSLVPLMITWAGISLKTISGNHPS